jgi:hypothetical protein
MNKEPNDKGPKDSDRGDVDPAGADVNEGHDKDALEEASMKMLLRNDRA